jgi:hypothetical protein
MQLRSNTSVKRDRLPACRLQKPFTYNVSHHHTQWKAATMTWNSALSQLDRNELVEFGIHQMDTKTATPKWRRHKGAVNFRFRTVRSALFSPDKGARAACLGYSSYASARYSASMQSIVPYVAVWSQGNSLAFLVRASAGDPEVTVVQSAALAAVQDCPHDALLVQLAGIFAAGAESSGIRLLGSASVYTPQ